MTKSTDGRGGLSLRSRLFLNINSCYPRSCWFNRRCLSLYVSCAWYVYLRRLRSNSTNCCPVCFALLRLFLLRPHTFAMATVFVKATHVRDGLHVFFQDRGPLSATTSSLDRYLSQRNNAVEHDTGLPRTKCRHRYPRANKFKTIVNL